jgi:hypothetical protein
MKNFRSSIRNRINPRISLCEIDLFVSLTCLKNEKTYILGMKLLKPTSLSLMAVMIQSLPAVAETDLNIFLLDDDLFTTDVHVQEEDVDGDGWDEALVKNTDCDAYNRCNWFLLDRDFDGDWEVVFGNYGSNPYFFFDGGEIRIASDGVTWEPSDYGFEPVGSELGRISPAPGTAHDVKTLQSLTGKVLISPDDLQVYEIDLVQERGPERVILRQSERSLDEAGYEVTIVTQSSRTLFHAFVPGPTKVYKTDIGALIYDPINDDALHFLGK